MMAAEADRRGFFTAKKKAFVGDGQGYNWTIQQRWFPDFVPIADFVHAVEYVYTAAKTVHADAASRWRQYLEWATACWKGDVAKVIADLARVAIAYRHPRRRARKFPRVIPARLSTASQRTSATTAAGWTIPATVARDCR